MGRALAASFGVAFEVVRFGHLSHHRFNRHALDRPDVLEGDRPVAARIGFYAGLLGGMYAFELAATLMTLLPRRLLRPLVERLAAGTEPTLVAVRNGVQRAVADVRLSRARVDCAAAALLYGAAIFLYGDAWPLLVAAVGARGMIVSLLDNAAHYGTPAVPGAPVLNLRAPRLLSLLLLNQNLHGIHHRWPGLAWHALPRAFAASGVDYDGSYVRAVLRQLRGPRQASTTFDPASARA
jgi:fatty acid desaturase